MQAQDLEISLLSKDKKVIPLISQYSTLTVTDIKLPDLLMTNRTAATIKPLDIQIVGKVAVQRLLVFKLAGIT